MITLDQLVNLNIQNQRHLRNRPSGVSCLTTVFVVLTIALTITLLPAKSARAESTIIEESMDIQISVIMDKVSGDDQMGLLGKPLEKPFVVKITNKKGNLLTNLSGNPIKVPIFFELIEKPPGAEGAVLSYTETTTDEKGQATTILTLGDKPGVYKVKATSKYATTGSPQTFIVEGIDLDKLIKAYNKTAELSAGKIKEFNRRADEYNASVEDFLLNPSEEKMESTLDKLRAVHEVKDELIPQLTSLQSQAEKIDEVVAKLKSEGVNIALYMGGKLGYVKYDTGVAVAAIRSLSTEEEGDWLGDTWSFITSLPQFTGHWIGSALGSLIDLFKVKEATDGMLEWKRVVDETYVKMMLKRDKLKEKYDEKAFENPDDNIYPIANRDKYPNPKWTKEEMDFIRPLVDSDFEYGASIEMREWRREKKTEMKNKLIIKNL